MRLSNTHFDPSQPYWRDYLPYLQQLAGQDFPGCEQLNALLAPELRSASGAVLHFVPSNELEAAAYEQRIYYDGQISTRPKHWHDLFNALVWMRFPCLKRAINAMHNKAAQEFESGQRGPLRDALTLFDECGVIVFSSHSAPLQTLANRDWSGVFQQTSIYSQLNYIICGHAMLEKYLSPYKSMTAKALLVKVDAQTINLPPERLLTEIDQRLASLMLNNEILSNPACLSPLPLAGIPGWWPDSQQDQQFYSDPDVFRPPPINMTPAPVITLG